MVNETGIITAPVRQACRSQGIRMANKTNESQVTLEGPEGRQPGAVKMAGALSHSGQVSSEAVAVRCRARGDNIFLKQQRVLRSLKIKAITRSLKKSMRLGWRREHPTQKNCQGIVNYGNESGYCKQMPLGRLGSMSTQRGSKRGQGSSASEGNNTL